MCYFLLSAKVSFGEQIVFLNWLWKPSTYWNMSGFESMNCQLLSFSFLKVSGNEVRWSRLKTLRRLLRRRSLLQLSIIVPRKLVSGRSLFLPKYLPDAANRATSTTTRWRRVSKTKHEKKKILRWIIYIGYENVVVFFCLVCQAWLFPKIKKKVEHIFVKILTLFSWIVVGTLKKMLILNYNITWRGMQTRFLTKFKTHHLEQKIHW